MLKRTNKGIISVLVLALSGIVSYAQEGEYGAFTPYSVYGIGDLNQGGSAYTTTMGGVGIASRNNRFVNPLNPASVTARDSLSFMIDLSLSNKNSLQMQGNSVGGKNIVNLQNCTFSFPLYKSSAMMVGIAPFSSTGYIYREYITDPNVVGNTGTSTFNGNGTGNIYQLYVAGGVTLWKKLSLGAQYNYYFGTIEKTVSTAFSETSIQTPQYDNTLKLKGHGVKFGLQFEQKLGSNSSLIIGATYRLATKLGGTVENFGYVSGTVAADTTSYNLDSLSNSGKVSIGDEIGAGIAFTYGDKFRAEFNYTRADWTKSGFDAIKGFAVDNRSYSSGSTFTSSVSQAFRLGVEYVPNRNDIRYYMRKVAYRGGLYYKTDYFKVDGIDINSYGVTLGATLPVFRWYNGLTLGLDLGTRGSKKNNMVREYYFNFSVGVNLFDIWFQKYRYE